MLGLKTTYKKIMVGYWKERVLRNALIVSNLEKLMLDCLRCECLDKSVIDNVNKLMWDARQLYNGSKLQLNKYSF